MRRGLHVFHILGCFIIVVSHDTVRVPLYFVLLVSETIYTMFKLLPGYNATPMTHLAMQLPMFGHGSAYALDWNDDGVLDLFHHNHFVFTRAKTRWSDPSTSAVGPRLGGCMVDWDAMLRNGNTGKYSAPNGGDGFIEWSDAKPIECFDAHSSAFLDIDGDGIKDFYLVTGGGRGGANSERYDNALFWGEKDEKSELGFRLVGGRDAARAAGLHGRNDNGNQRGRHHYWFDADGDGLLDVVTLNTERVDNEVVPGRFYLNMNGRKFNESGSSGRNFTEFARMAVLTDVDGDGFARELVVPSQCKGTSRNNLCLRSPRFSLSVFQYDLRAGGLRRKTLTQLPPTGLHIHEYGRSIATEDFDLDGKPDIAILWGPRVDFYMSSTRQQACRRILDHTKSEICLLRMGEPSTKVDMKPICGEDGATGIRFADFNLNGRIDMLVICSTPGRHGIYELVASTIWRKLRGAGGSIMRFGDLNSLDYMFGPKDFCKGVPTTSVDVRRNNICTNHLSFAQCKSLRYDFQFAICSLHRQNRVRAFAPTVADLDNDGFLDIILGYHYGSMVIVRNTLKERGNKNRFLAVRVDANAGPAASIGAIVELTASHMGQYQNETKTQLRVVSTLSHETDAEGGAEDRKVFGLGRGGRPTRLKVQWPHCCKPTVITGRKLLSSVNSMDYPYEVPAPRNCDNSCLKRGPFP